MYPTNNVLGVMNSNSMNMNSNMAMSVLYLKKLNMDIIMSKIINTSNIPGLVYINYPDVILLTPFHFLFQF